MPQYLLNMIQPDGEAPEPEFLEPIMPDLRALQREMKAAGAWVFSAGLHAAEHRDGRAPQRRRDAADRRPVRRGQRAHRRLHDRRGARPRRRAAWAGSYAEADHAADRGPPGALTDEREC